MKGHLQLARPSWQVARERQAVTQVSPVPPAFPESVKASGLVESGFFTEPASKGACVGDGRNSSGDSAHCFPAHFEARLKSRRDTRRCFEASPGERPSCSITCLQVNWRDALTAVGIVWSARLIALIGGRTKVGGLLCSRTIVRLDGGCVDRGVRRGRLGCNRLISSIGS